MSRTFRRKGRWIKLPDYFEWVERKRCDNTWKSRYVDTLLLKKREHVKIRQDMRRLIRLLLKDAQSFENMILPYKKAVFWEDFAIY